jgi:hypothetical protein
MREVSLILPVPLPLPFPHFLSPPSPAIVLLLYLPLEGKTKGLWEVTSSIAGEREGKTRKVRKGEEGCEREREGQGKG